MSTPLLQIQNLSVDFCSNESTVNAVKNISLNVDRGEIVAIVGESGSGKSVTSLSIMQLLPKQANAKGNILFTKEDQRTIDLLQLSETSINKIRGKDIAMIFQEPMTSLNPVLTCGSQLMETILLHQKVAKKIAKQKTIELFDKVKLPEPAIIFNRYPHQLSGGQKQRVMIAMAMSCSPSLLIADEPTTALDVTVQKTILALIKELQSQTGMGVILITHDLGVAAEVADKIIVMNKGEIVEQGMTKEVLQNPQDDYTKMLINCRPEEKRVTTDDRRHTTEEEPILKVENLKVYFTLKKKLFGKPTEYFQAVDDVSFEIYKGETVGLVGESGCGKTTLGRTILQLIEPTSGNIILNGINLASLKQKEIRPLRKNLQIIFQDPYGSLNPRITIGEAILEPMEVHGVLTSARTRKERVIELLEK